MVFKHVLMASMAAIATGRIVGGPLVPVSRRPLAPALRRPALAAMLPEPFSKDEAIDFALDNSLVALRFYTYVLDASIFVPIIPGLRSAAAIQPLMSTVYALSNPYFNAFRRALPFTFGSLDLSYIPAFYSLGFLRRELTKRKMERAATRYRAELQQYEQFYAK